jgi:hypothetical protein
MARTDKGVFGRAAIEAALKAGRIGAIVAETSPNEHEIVTKQGQVLAGAGQMQMGPRLEHEPYHIRKPARRPRRQILQVRSITGTKAR